MIIRKNKPKILYYDIETLYNVTAQWQLRDEYTPYQNILIERSIVCIAYKWEGEKKIHTISISDEPRKFQKDPHDDKRVIEKFLKVLSNADYTIAHNGDNFDLKMLKARAIKHSLNAPPRIKSIDTLKEARKHFKFNSNRLDYLGQYSWVGRKIPTSNDLWLGILKKDISCVHKMVKYNIQDVRLLVDVYNKLKPYINAPIVCYSHGRCPFCSGSHLVFRGYNINKIGKKRRLFCNTCGKCHQEDRYATKHKK